MDTGHVEMTTPLLHGANQQNPAEIDSKQSQSPNKTIGTLAEEQPSMLIHGKTVDSLRQYETSQHEDFYYVLQFPNPYDTHSIFKSDSKISISAGDEIVRKTFKVFENREKFYHTLRGSAEVSRGTTSEAKFNRQEMILDKWETFKASVKDKKVSYRKFLEHVLNSVLEVLQEHLKFKLEIIYSRDDDELFVKIWASEENLKIHADITDYLLQLRYDPTQEKAEWNRIPPYAQFDMTLHLPGQGFGQNQVKNIENLYKHFDDNDKQVKAGSMQEDSSSLFCYKDKVRLIYDQMCTAFDPDYLVEVGLMLGHYPLHNYKRLDRLKKKWVNNWRFWKKMNLCKVRLYFGEKIAMYFAWLEFYTRWMMFSSLIGIAVYVLEKVYGDLGEKNSAMSVSEISILAFTFLLCFSASLIDLFWIRKEKYIGLKWGTTLLDSYEGQRPAFDGDYKKDSLTGRFKKFPNNSIKVRFFKVMNMTVVLMFVLLVLAIIFSIFMWRATRIEAGLSVTACGIVMGIQIQIMTIVYFKVAKWLNDRENYETMTDYNDALTLKLYLFQFVNCYASLFYIAFFKKFFEGCYNNDCMTELSDSLFFIFMVNFVTNILDILIPFLLQSLGICWENKKVSHLKSKKVANIRTEMTWVEKQSKLDPYKSPTDDYMEIVCNYGYVVLFSSAYPLLPFLALLLNLSEIKIDAWRLCHQCQRPMPEVANSIGIWIDILRFLSIIGAFSNTGILIFTTDIFDSKSSVWQWITFMTVEHGIVIFKYVLTLFVYTTPDSVAKSLIWSQRIVNEKIYGKATDVDEQMKLRNLYLKDLPGYEPITLQNNISRSDG